MQDITPGILRADASDAMIRRLGIDQPRMWTMGGMASLMAGMNAHGGEIEGKHRLLPTIAVQAVFGHVRHHAAKCGSIRACPGPGGGLTGHGRQTADGNPPCKRGQKAQNVSVQRLAYPQTGKRLRRKLANVAAGKMALALMSTPTITAAPLPEPGNPLVSLTSRLRRRRSLSLCACVGVMRCEAGGADQDPCAGGRRHDAVCRRPSWWYEADGGKGRVERAELFWVAHQHYTSRPTAHITRAHFAGNEYTEMREIPTTW